MILERRQFLRVVGACVSLGSLSALAPRMLAARSWPDERTAGAFVCHADFQLSGFEALWREMSELQFDLTTKLRVPSAEERIHLFLFSNHEIYQHYLRLHFPGVPYRRALYIKDRGPGMVFAYRSDDFETDVRHESTHALLHASLPVVPLWLDEGLAEYFETSRDSREHDSPHLGRVKWSTRFSQARDMTELEAIDELSEMGVSEYRASWAWVHFILHGPAEAHEELVAYLADIRARTPPGLLSQRLQRKLPNLRDRFIDHFRTWK